MSLFGFKTPTVESLALIEIGADSVGGAYAKLERGKAPLMLYGARVPIEAHEGERAADALGRALAALGELLTKEGAPVLAKALGSGKIHNVIASVAAPWEETAVRVEKIESAKPFIFTKAMLAEAVERSSKEPPGKLLADEMVIATLLNGYAIKEPVGKRALRASIVILAGSVDRMIGERVAKFLRGLYHTDSIRLTAFTAVAYRALSQLFPHQDDYIAVEGRGGAFNFAVVKRSLLIASIEARGGPDLEKNIIESLKSLSQESPLPHTIFVLAHEEERETLRRAIESAHPEALWLSDAPPMIIPVIPEALVPAVRYAPEAKPDLFFALLALFYTHPGT